MAATGNLTGTLTEATTVTIANTNPISFSVFTHNSAGSLTTTGLAMGGKTIAQVMANGPGALIINPQGNPTFILTPTNTADIYTVVVHEEAAIR